MLVSRNIAPCATATADKCEDRVILAMGELTLTSGAKKRGMKRAEIAVFGAGQSYEVAVGSPFFEIAIKPKHPPFRAPAERIAAPANLAVHQGKTFFIYEEILPVGQTRPRHSHAQRVEIRLNSGPMLRQQIWRDGQMVETEPRDRELARAGDPCRAQHRRSAAAQFHPGVHSAVAAWWRDSVRTNCSHGHCMLQVMTSPEQGR